MLFMSPARPITSPTRAEAKLVSDLPPTNTYESLWNRQFSSAALPETKLSSFNRAHSSWASFGDVGSINGKEYVIVNRETLISMVAQGMDYSAVCTSLISDMSQVFKNRNKTYLSF